MGKFKRVIWIEGKKTFPSLLDAAAFFGANHKCLSQSILAGRKYKNKYSLVYEDSQDKPHEWMCGRFKHKSESSPLRKPVSEFRNGELFCIYPSIAEAAIQMGIKRKHLRDLLQDKYANNTGKSFALATPLDECLIEIRERNKQPYQ